MASSNAGATPPLVVETEDTLADPDETDEAEDRWLSPFSHATDDRSAGSNAARASGTKVSPIAGPQRATSMARLCIKAVNKAPSHVMGKDASPPSGTLTEMGRTRSSRGNGDSSRRDESLAHATSLPARAASTVVQEAANIAHNSSAANDIDLLPETSGIIGAPFRISIRSR